MEKLTIEVYSFEELDEKAQKVALDKHRDVNVDYYWYTGVTENAKDTLAEQGFEEADILFSGFGSQGDGASFTATVNLDKLCKALGYSESDTKKLRGYEVDVTLRRTEHRYEHENTVTVDVDFSGDHTDESVKLCERLDKDAEALRYKLSREIYRDLEHEYFMRISDDVVKETLVEGDYKFLKDGSSNFEVTYGG